MKILMTDIQMIPLNPSEKELVHSRRAPTFYVNISQMSSDEL